MSALSIAKPSKRAGSKGELPAEVVSLPNTQKAPSTGSVQLAVQIPADMRRAFKAYSAERDMSMSDLFQVMWEHYRATNG
ncbi:hypothetical protein NS365_18620 [Aureimonas ureilytica]|uniref:Uncharacterized protein n=1 Tax=Aureimonas ureilytica TaxID=401562 RepID=A0A175RHZ0_9HYPH|nr:hypothetical protein [Aureimonas ureilytica]KTR03355.1 hypothetical protein NS365_18620 [Aureimonas ureilytica]